MPVTTQPCLRLAFFSSIEKKNKQNGQFFFFFMNYGRPDAADAFYETTCDIRVTAAVAGRLV